MYFTALFSILLLALIPFHVQGRQCLPGLDTKVSYPTPSPINIITSKAIPANVTTPITVVSALFTLLKVINTGKTIEVFLNEGTDQSFITGGVLCNKKYKFHKGVFLINQNPFGRASNAVNGFGAPIEALSIYYNLKYSSFEIAQTKPDGLVQFSSLVNVGLTPNPFFYPTQFLLSSGAIKKPGSSANILSILFIPWISEALPFTFYYAYKGTYTDYATGKQYASAINIIPTVRQFISFFQFLAFRNVLAPNGKPLSIKSPIQPQGKRPVYLR